MNDSHKMFIAYNIEPIEYFIACLIRLYYHHGPARELFDFNHIANNEPRYSHVTVNDSR